MGNDLLTWLAAHDLTPIRIMQLAFSAVAAILFLQSGLDKVFNWKGESE